MVYGFKIITERVTFLSEDGEHSSKVRFSVWSDRAKCAISISQVMKILNMTSRIELSALINDEHLYNLQINEFIK